MAAYDVNQLQGGLLALDSGRTDLNEWAPYAIPVVPAVVGPSVTPVLQFESDLVQAQVDYGRDVSTFPDLDGALNASDNHRLLGEALLRRFTTPRGKLAFHEDYGTDLRAYLNETITDDVLARVKSDAELEVLQDERFESVEVQVSHAPSARTLTLKVDVVTADGPFEFTIGVDQLTAVLLGAEEG